MPPKAKAKAVSNVNDMDIDEPNGSVDVSSPEATPAPTNRRLGTSGLGSGNAVAGSSSGIARGASTLGAEDADVKDVKPVIVKTKFVPNMRKKKAIVVEEKEEIVKVRAPRAKAPPKQRVQLQMTASGPMAQGPNAAPTGRKTGGGGGGGGGAGISDYTVAELDSDVEQGDPDDEDSNDHLIRAVDINAIGQEDDMAPLTLPLDPKVVRSTAARRLARAESKRRVLDVKIKPEPEDDNDFDYKAPDIRISASATPKLEPDVKNEPDVYVPPEVINLTQDFALSSAYMQDLLMFQFPRKFPNFVNMAQADVKPKVKKESKDDIKPTMSTAPDWGRAGSRQSKGARFQEAHGKIGELRVHKSGKVTMKIHGDLVYEVLPAAQPTFLQEIVALDHNNSKDRPITAKYDPLPNNSLFTIGQTNKKYIVVPSVDTLLTAVAAQEKEEKLSRDKEARAIKLKREGK